MIKADLEIQATFLNGGGFAICKLNEDKVIQGIPCRAGTEVLFYKSGRLWQCQPSGNFQFEGSVFEGQGITEFHENGGVWRGRLAESAGIQGIWCKGGEQVEFSETGLLTKCTLARDSIIEGMPCSGSTELWLASGFPIRNTLFQSLFIKDMNLNLSAGTEILLTASGVISGFSPGEDINLGDIRCKRDRWIWLHLDTRKISGCFLGKDTVFEGVICRGDTEVNFHENGKILRCYLAGDQVIQGIKAKSSTFVLFHKNGRLSACELAEDMEFQSIPCRGRNWIGFHEDGSLKRCILAEDKSRQGILLKAGSWASFFPDGRLEEYKEP